ncbi:MAG: hypothetical protein P4L43_01685 [Syntrophobacteraceae bacterium]|nr:hypothetical protein [Syntrophobacteraceae bacterium]
MEMDENLSFQNIASTGPAPGSAEVSERVEGKGFEGYFRKVTHGLSREIESETRSFASEQLKTVSSKLDDVAEVLSKTAGNFREKQKNALADLVEAGSEGAARISRELRENYTERFAMRLENLVRNRPWILLGGAFAATVLVWSLSSVNDPKRLGEPFVEPAPSGKEQPYGPH